jgi:hypothetical protein
VVSSEYQLLVQYCPERSSNKQTGSGARLLGLGFSFVCLRERIDLFIRLHCLQGERHFIYIVISLEVIAGGVFPKYVNRKMVP